MIASKATGIGKMQGKYWGQTLDLLIDKNET